MVLWRVSALPDNPCLIKVEHSCLFPELQFHLLHTYPPLHWCSLLKPPPSCSGVCLAVSHISRFGSLSVTHDFFPPHSWLSCCLNSSFFPRVLWLCYLTSRPLSSLPLKCPELCCCWTCIHSVTTYTCLCILLSTVWYELFLAIKIRIKEPAFALTRLPR